MGIPHGDSPWGIPMGIPQGESPWGIHMGNPHRESVPHMSIYGPKCSARVHIWSKAAPYVNIWSKTSIYGAVYAHISCISNISSISYISQNALDNDIEQQEYVLEALSEAFEALGRVTYTCSDTVRAIASCPEVLVVQVAGLQGKRYMDIWIY